MHAQMDAARGTVRQTAAPLFPFVAVTAHARRGRDAPTHAACSCFRLFSHRTTQPPRCSSRTSRCGGIETHGRQPAQRWWVQSTHAGPRRISSRHSAGQRRTRRTRRASRLTTVPSARQPRLQRRRRQSRLRCRISAPSPSLHPPPPLPHRRQQQPRGSDGGLHRQQAQWTPAAQS